MILLMSNCAPRNPSMEIHPYNLKDENLIRNLDKLNFDSVKVFAFNCQRSSWNDYGYVIDSANLYYKKSSKYFNKGKILSGSDVKNIMKRLKESYKDKYPFFTVTPYIPTMGIAFFYEGEIIAHLDISTYTSKMNFEITKDGKQVYLYDWITMGVNMRKAFDKLCRNYKLECCD
jgi:hypothetical protein